MVNTTSFDTTDHSTPIFDTAPRGGSFGFRVAKRTFDIVVGLALLPLVLLFGIALLIVNPFANKGKLFFVQPRMGRDTKAFNAIKFRSMRAVEKVQRSADCPLEVDRITPLGGFLRKSRIDELPQVLNVLKGDMSLIGPRPDYYDHALHYIEEIPGYRERHDVRPGISGYAQTELGYIEGVEATRRKVAADLHYIENASFALEAWIFWRTLVVVFKRAGS
ncbi:sugar transferase [Tropicibacter naphthalenivorans]|uniref:UDP-glucose:undecaprenyl-phosphate glucose-1-phosphate transferase n=1 Tax=Tropicibacter naphthalenivorans TaxID=441103 RepID=A0A0P1GYC9_9RHOB|nr:sugar transferase [Tropicibacter naphthalenivorans]CUH80912.1 UDP-glucose:undecaprenyl-phosphate glucose-1-phosphate transferase [Tropicibacter naphthalenivorans]SMC91062.1 Sugar transferase involved in LPS biosynthesis (colanic, teichoic acid) [Tropicibacter naphthalenivorans]